MREESQIVLSGTWTVATELVSSMRFMSTRLIADLQCSEFVIINFHPATCLVACGTCWIFR